MHLSSARGAEIMDRTSSLSWDFFIETAMHHEVLDNHREREHRLRDVIVRRKEGVHANPAHRSMIEGATVASSSEQDRWWAVARSGLAARGR